MAAGQQRAAERRMIGERLRAERARRGWNRPDMARALQNALDEAGERQYPDLEDLAGYVKRWENGKVGISRRYRAAYSRAFGMPENVLFVALGTGNNRDGQLPSSQATHFQPPNEEDDMHRRRLLQALAALGISVPAFEVFDALGEIREGVDRLLGRNADSHLDEWEATVVEYGYAYISQPPQQLLGDLAADLVLVQQAMLRHGHDTASWSRVLSGMSLLMAKTLGNLGQSQQARPWWTTARRAAERSGDKHLELWVRAEEVAHGLYDQRPLPVLRDRIEEIIAKADGSPCRGLAGAHALNAQILAMEGNGPAAVEQLRRCTEVFQRLPDSVTKDASTVNRWSEDRLRYVEAWVHAFLGNRASLDQATGKTLALLSPSDRRVRTQVRLLQACGHIRAGDTTEGIRHAQRVYEQHPAEYCSTMVQTLAEHALAAVPANRRTDPLVTGYQELINAQSRRAMT